MVGVEIVRNLYYNGDTLIFLRNKVRAVMKKLLLIVNPRAGKTKSRTPLFDAVAHFSKAGYLVSVFVTEGRGGLPLKWAAISMWSYVPAATGR